MIDVPAIWQYLCTRLGLDAGRPRDDRGAITTEMAVVIFVLVTAAVGVLAVVTAAAMDTAENIPVPSGA